MALQPGDPGSSTASWCATAVRVALAAVFAAAGLSKAGDLTTAGRVVAAYQLFPYSMARVIGVMLPFLEIMLGLLLLVGIATRTAAMVAAGLLTAFTVAVASVWARGLSVNCGCFGGGGAAIDPTRGYVLDIVRDVVLLGLTAFLIVHPRSRFGLDSVVLLPEGPP